MCSPLASSQDIQQLYGLLRNAFTLMAMLDYPYSTHFMGNMPANPVKVGCETMLSGPDLLTNLRNTAGIVYNSTGELSCFDLYTLYLQCADPTGCGLGLDSLAWDYQACTEINLCYESNNVTDMFPPMAFTETDRERYCFQRWAVLPRPGWLKTQFWGDGSNAADPVSVIRARKTEAELIAQWVEQERESQQYRAVTEGGQEQTHRRLQVRQLLAAVSNRLLQGTSLLTSAPVFIMFTMSLSLHHVSTMSLSLHHVSTMSLSLHNVFTMSLSLHNVFTMSLSLHNVFTMSLSLHHVFTMSLSLHHVFTMSLSLHHVFTMSLSLHLFIMFTMSLSLHHVSTMSLSLHNVFTMSLSLHNVFTMSLSLHNVFTMSLSLHNVFTMSLSLHNVFTMSLSLHHVFTMSLSLHHVFTMSLILHHEPESSP
ncbi:hypothetical protein F7725_013427 [Dissostichus mawsoni]|uniref:Uncharacterized protein n=1 Tax=Dissostichus mawsoni TaxID=36200 RepID=A0A7J5YQC7_DISMA|nr:hypothetical protein F7725_013427 [Dissostichus mawsoni]